MTQGQQSFSVASILLGLSKLSEFEGHQVLIRQVAHLLETGRLGAASELLQQGHAILEMGQLLDLARLVETKADLISAEVQSPDWTRFQAELNVEVYGWQNAVEKRSFPELLSAYLSFERTFVPDLESARPEPKMPLVSKTVTHGDLRPRKPDELRPIKVGLTAELPTIKSNEAVENKVSDPSPNINMLAALVTFFTVLVLALWVLWWVKR